MFITALFIIAKIWKQPKYPLIDEWIKKTATTQLDLEDIMLSERS